MVVGEPPEKGRKGGQEAIRIAILTVDCQQAEENQNTKRTETEG
jgi:hypothetical protein